VFSFLPNVGLGVGGGHLLSDTPRRSWSLELGATYQFLDDEDFAADGNPKAGPWYQVRAGLKTSAPYAPEEGRHLTGRLGAVWLQANGEPNILQRAGNHVGLYGGIGFETHLTSSLSVGPEVTFLFVSRQDELSLARPIPQLNWHAIWWPGRTYSGSPSQLGEVYGGVTAVSSPWLGGGFEAGQVFTKSALATWSWELLIGWQNPTGAASERRWAQFRLGVKAGLSPTDTVHWTARGGLAWLRNPAENRFLDDVQDHIGAYFGVGREYDVGTRLAHGPELTLILVSAEQKVNLLFLPQLSWHAVVKL